MVSVLQLVTGDVDGAIETQQRFVDGVSRTVDGIPIVGHAKAVIHYACDDTEGGDRAMMSATRTTQVMAAGAVGFLAGGPVGAVAGGVVGGVTFDTNVTIIDSAFHNEYRPSGTIGALDNVLKNPNAGDIFDTCFIFVSDGLNGYSGGRLVNAIARGSKSSAGPSGKQPPKPLGAAKLAKGK